MKTVRTCGRADVSACHVSRVTCHDRVGFTLVEMMLVVIIIATLAAMVIPRLAGRTEQAKISRSEADLASVGLALDLYELDMGSYPASLEELTSREAPSDLGTGVQWNGPYLKKGLPSDPWGRPYQYECPGQHNAESYDLWSFGQDGQAGTDDDIKNFRTE